MEMWYISTLCPKKTGLSNNNGQQFYDMTTTLARNCSERDFLVGRNIAIFDMRL